ncbi:hypothetical protein ACFVZW_11460 [Streptomyces sp. NPDC059567]|uniref:hypothetical protein n=1 Tax=Streptomyces sp. NPDC059567 TaxID=3346867 RepID=UPI0036CBE7B8
MRSIISRKLFTAAAATGILSLTGGFALAANSGDGPGDSPHPDTGHHLQVPLPANLCGHPVHLEGPAAVAVGDLCAHPGKDEPDGYGDDDGHENPDHPGEHPTKPPTHSEPPTKPPTTPPTKPPTTHPPTKPPTTHPTKPPTTPPTKPPTTPPTKPPTTPPTKPPTHSEPPTKPPTTHPPTKPPTKPPTTHPTKPPTTTAPPTHPGGPGGPGKPELPDTGGDAALMGAAAVSAALLIGGSVVYLRAGRVARAGRPERRH